MYSAGLLSAFVRVLMYTKSSVTRAIVDFWSLMPWLTEKFQDILFIESEKITFSLKEE